MPPKRCGAKHVVFGQIASAERDGAEKPAYFKAYSVRQGSLHRL